MRRADAAIILSWFVLSRLAALAAGVEPLPGLHEQYWQLLPIDLLQHRLAESLWYLHSQPPLYNALIGVLLELPGDYVLWWRLLWVGCGLAFPLLMFACVRHAGAPRPIAHGFALVVGLNPTLLLYENLLLYSYPEALCVLAGMWALMPRRENRPAWLMFGVVTSTLVLLRAMFQPVWSLGLAVAVLTGLPRIGRAAVAAVTVPLLVGVLLAAKNGVMFEVWTSSTWYGQNLAKLMTMAMLGETPRLVAAGVVSPMFATGPFVPLMHYPPDLVGSAASRAVARFGAVPALTQVAKENGSPNFNHVAYVEVSRQLAADSAAAYHARPWLVYETIVKGVMQFHHAASLYPFLDANRRRLAVAEDVYTRALYPGQTLLVVQAAVVLTIVSSAVVWLFGIGRFLPLRPAAGYVLVTVVWVAVTGNLAEFGENMRFRFTIDPLMVTWLGVVAAAWAAPRVDDHRA